MIAVESRSRSTSCREQALSSAPEIVNKREAIDVPSGDGPHGHA